MANQDTKSADEVRIAILYICTGQYSLFWQDFYRSAEEFLFNKFIKHYFVFTDDISIKSGDKITVLHKEYGGFPHDSMFRFEMFNGISRELQKFDYVYFFNSNMRIIKPVSEDIFPDSYESGLVGVIHPGHYNHNPVRFPYERNPRSKAYIPHKYNSYKYYMGGMFGGVAESFLRLSERCAEWIRDDLKSGIVAVYHDESHLNRYFIETKILELDPGYGYPEGWNIPFTPRIILMDKVLHGGNSFVKERSPGLIKKFQKISESLFNGFLWYLS
jgi:hypothetical protein